MNRRSVLIAAALAVLAWPGWAWAQNYGAGTTPTPTSSMFGSRTLGSSINAPTSNFNGSPAATASTGTGQGAGLNNQQNVGQIAGNERFVRGARQPGQFVGADTGDTQNFFSALGGGGLSSGTTLSGLAGGGLNASALQALGGANRNRTGFGAGGNFGGFGGNARNLIPYRTTLRVDFEYSRPAPTALGTRLAERLSTAPAIRSLGPITVEMADRTAILRGEVATPRARELAGRLVLLEAGVAQVQNELTVASNPADPFDSSATPETTPASSSPATPLP